MNAIITGGGGGIGSACARLLASSGSNVLVVDADLVAAERIAREINEGAGGKAIAAAADVSIAADVQRYVARAAAWGRVDGIVHAAGIAGPFRHPTPSIHHARPNESCPAPPWQHRDQTLASPPASRRANRAKAGR